MTSKKLLILSTLLTAFVGSSCSYNEDGVRLNKASDSIDYISVYTLGGFSKSYYNKEKYPLEYAFNNKAQEGYVFTIKYYNDLNCRVDTYYGNYTVIFYYK